MIIKIGKRQRILAATIIGVIALGFIFWPKPKAGDEPDEVEVTDPAEVEQLDVHTRYNDRIITAIRTSKGLLLPALEKEFGKELHDFCLRNARHYLTQGKLTIENDWLRLTRAGIFISDGIMSDLLWVDEDAC